MRRQRKLVGVLALTLALAGCSDAVPDPRGVDRNETLLSVAATGRSEARPDEARFTVGVSSIAASSEAATQQNNEKMTRVTAALTDLAVAKDDLRTRQLTVNRIDWGRNKGRFEAVNQVEVRMRKIDAASQAIAAVTAAGANILSGPDMRVSDKEAATKSAYAAAYRAAKLRAEAYAGAADLKIARVLRITDGGMGQGPEPYYADAMAEQAAAPPPVSAPPINPGLSETEVTVRVDFALEPQ